MRILIVVNAGADPQLGIVPADDGLIEIYYLFRDAGIDIVLAAPGGGSAESSEKEYRREGTAATQALRRYNADRHARDVMNDLVDLDDVCAEDFDAALCLNPPGFPRDGDVKEDSIVVLNQLLAAAKPVALIGGATASIPVVTGNGLLMIGRGKEALRTAANALLCATRSR